MGEKNVGRNAPEQTLMRSVVILRIFVCIHALGGLATSACRGTTPGLPGDGMLCRKGSKNAVYTATREMDGKRSVRNETHQIKYGRN